MVHVCPAKAIAEAQVLKQTEGSAMAHDVGTAPQQAAAAPEDGNCAASAAPAAAPAARTGGEQGGGKKKGKGKRGRSNRRAR